MKILSLSTAGQGCSLAVTRDRELLYEEYWGGGTTHSKRALKMIDHALEKKLGIALKDIDGFVVSRGPGSFTGLRIGISLIKGLSQALEKPAAGVSSLDGIGFRFSHLSIPVCAVMDARRDEVYYSFYQFQNGILISKSSEGVAPPEQAASAWKGKILFAGSGAEAYKDIIKQKADEPLFADSFQNHVSALAMVQSLYSKASSGNIFSERGENGLNPVYIRKSDAQLQFGRHET